MKKIMRMNPLFLLLSLILLWVLLWVLFHQTVLGDSAMESLMISSKNFTEGQRLPVDFTCDGKDHSPQLSWDNVPSGVKSFSIICDDPDAPSKTWVHWIVFNIPSSVNEVPEGVLKSDLNVMGALLGRNDFKRLEWGGACPPKGHGVHHYNFTVYALDTTLDLLEGASRAEIDQAMEGHIVTSGKLLGTYSRE